MTDVFLSYARKNREKAQQIADSIVDDGYSLWWDTALKASDNCAIKIEQALEDSKSVVVCWSQQANKSLWVRAEATEALDHDKLIQFKLDDSRMPGTRPAWKMGGLQSKARPVFAKIQA